MREGPDGDPSGRRVGRIVELEAYLGPDDRASHARFGPTGRSGVMYGPPGRAYVYLVYGMHDCLNIVTEPAGTPAALLLRAVEPLAGIEAMRDARERRADARRRAERAVSGRPHRGPPDHRVAAGPGLVTAAFDLDRSHTGVDLFDPEGALRIELAPDDEPSFVVATGPRVGIAYAGPPWTERRWRFAIAGHPSVSRPPLPTD